MDRGRADILPARPRIAAATEPDAVPGALTREPGRQAPLLSSVETGAGLVVLDLGPGRVRLRAPLRAGSLGGDRRLHPALLAVVADSAAGISVFSHPAIPPTGVTVELRVDHVAPVAPGAGSLEVTGTALAVGHGFGTGRAEIRDDKGTLVAHAVGVMAGDPNGSPPPGPGAAAVPPMDPDVVGIVPSAPTSARVDVVPGMLNIRGAVHGGVLMALAHQAQDHYRRTEGAELWPLRLSVSYLRPAAGCDFLELNSAFVRRGRRMWTLRTDLRRPDGAVVAVATGTGAVLRAAPVVA